MHHVSAHSSGIRSIFGGRVGEGDEQKPSLQFIVLLMAWWVALSLGWIGTPPLVWIGGGLLITAGHAFSWLFRGLRSFVRSLVVALALVGVLALVPRTVSLAMSGDWLPVAQFLLLFQGITSFEMRTRGGLYASIGISGAIFFFVSQQALDITFGVFLTGFTTLLLSFLALSFLLDQVRDSDVRWFRGQAGFALFWAGVFMASMLVSAAIFLLMPKDFYDPAGGAEAIVLPMRASRSMALPEVNVSAGQMTSALPVTALGDGTGDEVEGRAQFTSEGGQDGGPQASSADQDAEGGGTGPGEGLASGDMDALEGQLMAALNAQGGIPEEEVVMQVRSPVLTYWRGAAYDLFEGGRWRLDRSALRLVSSNATRTIYSAPQPAGTQEAPLYSQTFYVRQDLPADSLFVGYAPLVVSLPAVESGDGAVPGGTVYRVISGIPHFTPQGLSQADPTSRLDFRYHQVPESERGLEAIARQITAEARSDAERIRRIVTFLDRSYEMDASALNRLALTAAPTEFLSEKKAGTVMDFATATVMLARASGIPARLVSGYLPGQFDPLSGTFLVRHRDRHVWAEVFLGGIGWVPFDSAPRPGMTALGEGGTRQPDRSSSLLSRAYGDDLGRAVRSSPQQALDFIRDRLGTGAGVVGALVGILSLAALGLVAFKRLMPLLHRRQGSPRYSRLEGQWRSEVLQLYAAAERLMKKAGLVPRSPAQTLGEYSSGVGPVLGDAASDLAWLRDAARVAAYDPGSGDLALLTEARTRFSRLKASLKGLRLQG